MPNPPTEQHPTLLLTKEFVNDLKLYLSAVSSRRCGWMYLNLTDDKSEYILSNMEPHDYIKFCEATFCMHFIKIHDAVLQKSIVKLFKFFKVPKDDPYVLKFSQIITILNKNKNDLSNIRIELDSNRILCQVLEDGTKVILGYPMVIFLSIVMMLNFYKQYSKLDLSEEIKKISMDIPKEYLDKGVLRIPLDLKNYFGSDKSHEFFINLVDGAETISNKQFINKLKKDYTYKLISWFDNKSVEYLTQFNDDRVSVISVRPFTRVYFKSAVFKKYNF